MRDDCIIWKGTILQSGYGQLMVGNKHWRAHRWAWTQEKGDIPEGLHVLHECDTRPCINVKHLFLGTHTDNMRDKVTKGRMHQEGERNPVAKFTETQIKEIRLKRKLGLFTYHQLAEWYGVDKVTIFNIDHKQTWTHVREPDLSWLC